MSAMVSFDRVFEVLDLRADDPARRPDAVPVPAGDRSIEFDHVSFSYPSAAEVSLASLEDVSLPEHGGPVDVLHDVSFRVEAGQLVALVGPSGAGKSTIANLVPRLYDVTGGSVRVGGVDVRRRDAGLPAGARSAWSARTRTCSTTRIRANLLYARPEATEDELWAALDGRADRRRWSARCPTGWTPWSATAATGCPAGRSSAWPSPGCCSRPRRS